MKNYQTINAPKKGKNKHDFFCGKLKPPSPPGVCGGGGMGSKKGETINLLEIGTVGFPKGDGPL